MSRVMLAIVGGGIVAHTVYLGREWEPEELVSKRLVRRASTLWQFSALTVSTAFGGCPCLAMGEDGGAFLRFVRRAHTSQGENIQLTDHFLVL